MFMMMKDFSVLQKSLFTDQVSETEIFECLDGNPEDYLKYKL